MLLPKHIPLLVLLTIHEGCGVKCSLINPVPPSCITADRCDCGGGELLECLSSARAIVHRSEPTGESSSLLADFCFWLLISMFLRTLIDGQMGHNLHRSFPDLKPPLRVLSSMTPRLVARHEWSGTTTINHWLESRSTFWPNKFGEPHATFCSKTRLQFSSPRLRSAPNWDSVTQPSFQRWDQSLALSNTSVLLPSSQLHSASHFDKRESREALCPVDRVPPGCETLV